MNKSRFLSDLHTVDLPHAHCVQLEKPLVYFSTKFGLIVVPVGFITDLESVPLLKGTSKRAGVLHDYVCRYDSIPKLTKQQAADLYLEAMVTRDNELGYFGFGYTLRRNIKAAAVRVAPGYYYVLPVHATLEQVLYGELL